MNKPDTLSPDQERAWLEVTSFCGQNEVREHALAGAAGTGKTFLLSRLVPYLESLGHTIYLTATTNQAAEVIAQMSSSYQGDNEAGTIHSLLGLQPIDNHDTGETELKQVRDPKVERGSIIVIDESSMIQTELLEVIRDVASRFGVKVLYVGDAYQLPPVFEKDSPVFTQVQGQSRLVTPQRQAADNPIIAAAHTFREVINGAPFQVIEENRPAITRLDRDAFESSLIEAFRAGEKVKAVAWTNRRVLSLNATVRNALVSDPSMAFAAGETVMINSAVSQWNRDTRKEELVLRTNEYVKVTSVRRANEYDVPGYAMTVKRVLSARDREYDAPENVKIFVPEDFEDTKAPLAERRSVAMDLTRQVKEYEEQGRDVPYKLEKDRRYAWGMFFKCQKTFVDARQVYASTVHKSQGSTYDKVYIDLNDIGANKRWYEVAKLVYVALTRAKEEVVILGDLRPQTYTINTQQQVA